MSTLSISQQFFTHFQSLDLSLVKFGALFLTDLSRRAPSVLPLLAPLVSDSLGIVVEGDAGRPHFARTPIRLRVLLEPLQLPRPRRGVGVGVQIERDLRVKNTK